MNKDEIGAKSCEIAEIPTVQDEDALTLKTPYYWSWYRCAFSRNDSSAGDERNIATRDKQ